MSYRFLALFCLFFGTKAQEFLSTSYNDITRSGVYLNTISSEKFVDFNGRYVADKSEKLITYDLLDLEKRLTFFEGRTGASELQNNLNQIYGLCGVKRMSYPYNKFNGLSYDHDELVVAIKNSSSILSDMESLKSGINIRSELIAKLNNTIRRSSNLDLSFDQIRKYMNFKYELKRIGSLKISVEITYKIPYVKDATLYEVSYLPFRFHWYEETIQKLKNQELKYAIKVYGNMDNVLLEDMSECEIIEGSMFCQIDKLKHQRNREKCLNNIVMNDRIDREYCQFSEVSLDDYDQFTHLNNGKFFFLFNFDSHQYEYKCDGDYDTKTGEIGMIEGYVTIGNNCKLSTGHATILGNNGLFIVQRMDNDELINVDFWNNFPWAIIGIVSGSIVFGILVIIIGILAYRRIRNRCCRSGNGYEPIIGDN
ncbi:hypothetical protein ACFFRR_006643 [Megaselia abdita]